ncbi:MAG TPA: hypothetical protein VKA46_00870 [Gemmataceae bacterium]|nr:hypothetical protein [Gemmataceae bacterium]
MYVEAICPLCRHTHVIPADLRGERYRCDECEEIFLVNRRSKKTDKRPPRPRTVRPADEPEAEVLAADAPEVLPVATGASTKRRRKGYDDRPRKGGARRRGSRVGLIVGLSVGGAVLLIGLAGFGAWWAFSDRGDKSQSNKSAAHSTDPNDRPVAQGRPRVEADPPKKDPQKPKNDPPKPEAGATWNVKADPPAAPVNVPADFKKEITARAVNTEVVFPMTTGSACVAVGDNFDDKDERQVWDLQTNATTGKLVGRRYSASPALLGPDGAHLAILPFGEREIVDVAALASGKKVRIDTGLPTEVVDFAGPGKLLVAGRQGAGLRLRLWDATTGKRERDFDGPALGAQVPLLRDMVAVSPGGAYLAVVTPEDLWVWDLKTGTAAGRRALPWNAANWLLPCRGLSFSPDGRELAGFFEVNGQSRLVCWNLMAQGEPAFDVTFPAAKVRPNMLLAYAGQVLGWVGDRRGWLLYGQMFIDRKADKVGPAPAGLLAAEQPFRRMVGPDHVATLPGGLGGNKVLTVSRFDPDKPGGP